MRRDFLRDRPPRPWDKPSSIWGSLSLSVDEPKQKPGETAIKVGVSVRQQILNAMARQGFVTRNQAEKKYAQAISAGILRILEEEFYGRVRAYRKD